MEQAFSSKELGYRKELASIEDPDERRVEFERRAARAYEGAKAVNASVGGRDRPR
ncbi:MAG: hypothetical protein O7E57_02835 [Gammaproteobacteria bacterium]|nr:hypothetical protein [Gammaproteobacteria bacterium]